MKPRRQNSANVHPAANGHNRAKSTRSTSAAGKPAQQQQQQQQSLQQQQHYPTQISSTPSPSPAAAAQQGAISPAQRYVQNLKVLRRHDPSIVSIIDQFSYVCIYQYVEPKWEKKGFEGSFFVFERRAYPPYGLYILNRMGVDDYVRYVYPEDVLEIRGQFLLWRSFPEYSARRIAHSNPLPPNAPLSVYTTSPPQAQDSPSDPRTNWRLASESEDKGRAETVGLWMHATGDPERDVKEVMKRLHAFVRDGVPYPAAFRKTPAVPADMFRAHGLLPDSDPADVDAHDDDTQAGDAQTETELDKLFAKLRPTPVPRPAQTQVQSPPGSLSKAKTQTQTPGPEGKVTLADLFASASAGGPAVPPPSKPHTIAQPQPQFQPHPQPQSNLQARSPPPQVSSANRGIALLDSIFASATPQPPTPAPVQPQPPPASDRQLGSQPQPRGARQQPQPQARALSSLEPSTSGSAHEIHSPKPAVAALPQILTQDVISQLLGMPPTPEPEPALATAEVNGRRTDDTDADAIKRMLQLPTNGVHAHVHGDATPRPVDERRSVNGTGSGTPSATANRTGTPSAAANRTGTGTPSGGRRPLVPFHEDSALWPYPRAPLDDRDDGGGAGLVELDFADTHALSDMDAFALLKGKGGPGAEGDGGGGGGAGKKKGRRARKAEKEREREREREAIQAGWDVPEGLAAGKAKSNGGSTTGSTSEDHGNGELGTMATATATKVELGTLFGQATQDVICAQVGRGADTPLERRAFVREVLTLIHTDAGFVDKLYSAYLAGVGTKQ